MTQVIHIRCDRCGALQLEPYNVVHLTIQHSENFDLRDESLDLCSECEKAAVEWLTQKPEKKA